MRALSEIQGELNEVTAAIERLDRALAKHRELPSLLANIRSLESRRENLNQQFLDAAKAKQIDVCIYKISTDAGMARVQDLANILGSFQAFYSVVYDALKNGRKATRHLSAEAFAQTQMNFAFSFQGSLGVVMTLPEELLLIPDSRLDEAMRVTLSMTKAESLDQVRTFAERLGPAPIRALFQWADAHVSSGRDAQINWGSAHAPDARVIVHDSELKWLRDAIGSITNETVEPMRVACNLVGADTTRRTFHAELPGAKDIRGQIAETVELGGPHRLELPRRYWLTMTKTVRETYSTDQVEETYLLTKLEPID
jgi:hypothetical protein